MANWEEQYRQAMRQQTPNAPATDDANTRTVEDWRARMGTPNVIADPATTERRPEVAGQPWVQGGTQQQWNAIPTGAAPTAQPVPTQPSTGMDPNASWGGFGTYGNWANAFASQHQGRVPTKQDEADYWWSQMYANKYGRGPSYGEWVNKWETGEPNQSMPWQLRVGSPYYGQPFENMRGSVMPQQYQSAVASPGALPNWLQQGFVPWYQQIMGGQNAAPQPAPTTPTTPQMGTPLAPNWWERGPGEVGRR